MSPPRPLVGLYACLVAFLTLAFVVGVFDAVRSALPETDLWWMMPTLFHYVDGRSPADVFGFVLSPAPLNFGQPVLKAYLFLTASWLDLHTPGLVAVSLVVHFANAVMLFVLGTRLHLGARISALSAVTYLTLFAHFHAYLWPTASQHVIGVFFILAVLNLYLKTDDLLSAGKPYRCYWAATLAAGFLASLQRGTLIAPAAMLTNILVSAEDDRDRIRRFDMWLPFFLIYLIYPVAALTFVGDVILTTYFARVPVPPGVKFSLVLLAGAAGLVAARVAVLQYPRYRRLNLLPWLCLILAIAVFLALYAKDRRNLLLPYHVLVPFVSMLASTFGPIEYALAIDSTEAYHFIPPAFGMAWVVAGLVLVAVFGKAFVASNRRLWLLVTWYALSLAHLLFQYSSHPVRTPSRYFIYLSPVFAIVFCTVASRVYEWMTARVAVGRLIKEVGLAVIFIGLLVPNIVAIKVEWWRGRLTNTYLIYDYVRVANFIRDDLAGSSKSAARIHVDNVVEMPFREAWAPTPVDPADYANFRLAMSEVGGDLRGAAVSVNDGSAATPGARVYRLTEHRVADERGREIGRFSRLYAEIGTRLGRGDHHGASGVLEEAIRTRPFLLNYVLDGHRLSDLRWVTSGVSMRTWVRKMAEKTLPGHEDAQKPRYVAGVIDRELSEYILCFFYLSYLEARSGEHEASRYWLSEIRYLEDDPAALAAWISRVPMVGDDADLLKHVTKFHEPAYFRDPLPWRQDDYGLERFLVRLFLAWDVRSKRERPVGA